LDSTNKISLKFAELEIPEFKGCDNNLLHRDSGGDAALSREQCDDN